MGDFRSCRIDYYNEPALAEMWERDAPPALAHRRRLKRGAAGIERLLCVLGLYEGVLGPPQANSPLT